MTSWTSGPPNMTRAVKKGECVWSNIMTPSVNVPMTALTMSSIREMNSARNSAFAKRLHQVVTPQSDPCLVWL